MFKNMGRQRFEPARRFARTAEVLQWAGQAGRRLRVGFSFDFIELLATCQFEIALYAKKGA